MNQRVLVTGAASGIGLEIARAFSNDGGRVFITDINEQALAAAQQSVPGLLTGVCDNSKRADIDAMVPAAVNALAGKDAMRRFEWDAPGSFFAEGRARRNALVAQHGKLDPILGDLLREEWRQNGLRHVAVAIPLAWCGAWVSGIWSF